MKKVLVFAIVVFALLVLFELIYLLGINKGHISFTGQGNKMSETVLDKMKQQTGLQFAEGVKSGILQSSITKDTYLGTISRIEKQGDSTRLDLSNEKGTIAFYYKRSDIDKTNVYSVMGESERVIEFTSLKVGDTVQIKSQYEVTKPWDEGLIDVVIRKLN